VGAMSEQSDQIEKIFTHTEKFLAKNLLFFLNCYDQLFSKFSIDLSQKRQFFLPKIGKNHRKL
jgi:hypothetical protein